MEIELNMDRLCCIINTLTGIYETGEFVSVKLDFTETELIITPIAGERKITL